MDSQKVHLAGCTRSVRLRDGMGVGATPKAWGGLGSLPRQARDGELVEPLPGDHAIGVTANRQKGSKSLFARLSRREH